MKSYLLIAFLFTSGCGGFAKYAIVTAGSFTGHILAEEYEYWDDDKESPNEKENEKNGLRNKTDK